jgi:hypothetical protein
MQPGDRIASRETLTLRFANRVHKPVTLIRCTSLRKEAPMDRIQGMGTAPGFPHRSHATSRARGRTSSLRLEWLEGRVMLSASPSIHAEMDHPVPSVPAINGAGSVQSTFVTSGVLTIGGPMVPVSSPQSGPATLGGGGNVNVSASASASNAATSSGTPGGGASNPASSGGGAVGSSASSTSNSAGNATKTSSPGTTTNAASASSSSSAGGGIPVFAGQLTFASGALATAPAPLPPMVAGASVGPGISAVPTTIVAQNATGISPLASAGTSVGTPSSLIGGTSNGGLIVGQSGNPGSGANLSVIAAAANIANPAPSSIFLGRGQVASTPQPITLDPSPETGELAPPASPGAVDAPAPAEAPVEFVIDFNVDVFPMNQDTFGPLTEATTMSYSAAPGSNVDLAETHLATASCSSLPVDPMHGGDVESNVGELLIVSSMLATCSVNLAFGGGVSRYRTVSWAPRHWPAARRSNKGARSTT